MKILKFFLLILFLSYFYAPIFAQKNSSEFMTPRDLINESASKIMLQNNRHSAVTVYGLYVRQYAYVTPGQSCNNAITIYPATNNITAGSFVMPTAINPGKRAGIGSNYLYNMLYQAIYYENIIIPSSPPGCALPGCTWGTDLTQYNWCIYLGALAPVFAPSIYTSNVPPSTEAASSVGGYDYNLISDYGYIGPISCNDNTLACTVESQQIQAFS